MSSTIYCRDYTFSLKLLLLLCKRSVGCMCGSAPGPLTLFSAPLTYAIVLLPVPCCLDCMLLVLLGFYLFSVSLTNLSLQPCGFYCVTAHLTRVYSSGDCRIVPDHCQLMMVIYLFYFIFYILRKRSRMHMVKKKITP